MMKTSSAVAYATCGLVLPPNPMVTTARALVAPKPVLAGVSWPFSVLINQNETQELGPVNITEHVGTAWELLKY